MWNPFKRPARGTRPDHFESIDYRIMPRSTQQDYVNHVWPGAVTQYGTHVTNTWWGNQMPGYTNFIPGVHPNLFLQQRNMQTQSNMVLSSGNNGTVNQMTPSQGDAIMTSQGTNYDAYAGGIWQRRDN